MARTKRRGETKRIPLDVDIDNAEERAIWEGYQEHGITWVREIIIKGLQPDPVPPFKSAFDRPATPMGRQFNDQLGKK